MKRNELIFRLLIAFFLFLPIRAFSIDPVYFGKPLLIKDDRNDYVNAHGGDIKYFNGFFYWYGEGKGVHAASKHGVNIYKSRDLHTWHFIRQGLISNNYSDLKKGSIVERPKVIYNKLTKSYVMFFHFEKAGTGYSSALIAFATSSNPEGPFNYVRSFRLNRDEYPLNAEASHLNNNGNNFFRDLSSGQMSRDMTVFEDDDGSAYILSSSEGNKTLILSELNNSFSGLTKKFIRIAPGEYNEAPVLFKSKGEYFIICSGSSGWRPNAARLYKSISIWGPWEYVGNPIRSSVRNMKNTFGGQGAFQFSYKKRNVFVLDIWNDKNLSTSKYLFLPINWDKNGLPFLKNTE